MLLFTPLLQGEGLPCGCVLVWQEPGMWGFRLARLTEDGVCAPFLVSWQWWATPPVLLMPRDRTGGT